jgi:hypothetical protein
MSALIMLFHSLNNNKDTTLSADFADLRRDYGNAFEGKKLLPLPFKLICENLRNLRITCRCSCRFYRSNPSAEIRETCGSRISHDTEEL